MSGLPATLLAGAVIGVLTGLISLAGVLLTQRRADVREDRHRAQDRERQGESWARDDSTSLTQQRREAYMTYLAAWYEKYDELYRAARSDHPSSLPEDWLDGLYAKLGLLNGAGTGANPLGVVGRAPEVTGATLVGAVAAAVAEIGEDGGRPTHLALSPTAAATEAAREGNDGHPVHPTGMAEMQGLTVVPVPGLVEPLVYDAARLYSVVARDFRVERSTDYAPAFKGDKVALKVTGRFGVGLPVPSKTVRTLTITP